jgi:FixJ family two-component response regulator
VLASQAGSRQVRTVSNATTIIIVDDDRSIRRALMLQLRLAGFKVRAFGSAQCALDMMPARDGICLLLDIYMPVMAGPELIRRLTDAGRRVPVVLMSGRDDEQTKTLIAGMSDSPPCLFKPFEQGDLLRAIKKAIDSDRKSVR